MFMMAFFHFLHVLTQQLAFDLQVTIIKLMIINLSKSLFRRIELNQIDYIYANNMSVERSERWKKYVWSDMKGK